MQSSKLKSSCIYHYLVTNVTRLPSAQLICLRMRSHDAGTFENGEKCDVRSFLARSRSSTRSRTIFSKLYRERKQTSMCSTKTAHPLSHSCFGLTIFMLYPKAHTNIMFMIFAITSKGTIVEIWSTRSLNAIPATIIRGVFNLYISNLLCKMYCKYLFIFSFIFTFFSSFFNHCKFKFFSGKFKPAYLSSVHVMPAEFGIG